MYGITLQQLRYFDAVVSQGSFQAAAAKLHRAHPTICAAVRSLEQQVGFELLDRRGYRVTLTQSGKSFHERVRELLDGAEDLQRFASCIARGDETQLRVVLGDICPTRPVLVVLNQFFSAVNRTQLQLQLDLNTEPCERLRNGSADLVFHHVEKSDQQLECIGIGSIEIVPVAAPGFLRIALSDEIAREQLKPYVQCVVRDTARERSPDEHLALPGARQLIVGKHQIKRDAILEGMAWGYLPSFLIDDDLRTGRLISIAGKHLRKVVAELSAARLRTRVHGPVATRLWAHLQTLAMSDAEPTSRLQDKWLKTQHRTASSQSPAERLHHQLAGIPGDEN